MSGRDAMGPRAADGTTKAPRQTYVYAIGDADQHLVKIGYSKNPPKRLSRIQTSCPFAICILWKTTGNAGLEDALHQHFAAYRRRGEWFEFPERNAVKLISEAAEEIPQPPPPQMLPDVREAATDTPGTQARLDNKALHRARIGEAAEHLRKVQGRLDAAVQRARADNRSWAAIGTAVGVTRQSAHERWTKR